METLLKMMIVRIINLDNHQGVTPEVKLDYIKDHLLNNDFDEIDNDDLLISDNDLIYCILLPDQYPNKYIHN